MRILCNYITSIFILTQYYNLKIRCLHAARVRADRLLHARAVFDCTRMDNDEKTSWPEEPVTRIRRQAAAAALRMPNPVIYSSGSATTEPAKGGRYTGNGTWDMTDNLNGDLRGLAVASRILAREGHEDMTLGHVAMRDPLKRGLWMKKRGLALGKIHDERDRRHHDPSEPRRDDLCPEHSKARASRRRLGTCGTGFHTSSGHRPADPDRKAGSRPDDRRFIRHTGIPFRRPGLSAHGPAHAEGSGPHFQRSDR